MYRKSDTGTRLWKLSKSCSPKVRQWQTFFVLLGSKETRFLLQLSCQKIKREGVLYMVLLILKRKSETLFADYNHEGFTLLFRSNLFACMVMVNSSVFRGQSRVFFLDPMLDRCPIRMHQNYIFSKKMRWKKRFWKNPMKRREKNDEKSQKMLIFEIIQ